MQRVLMALGLAFGLSACSSQSGPPQFSASGYIADSGVVRIWRQDNTQQQPQVLMSVYSPYSGDNTRVTFYEYQNGLLREIRRNDLGHNPQSVELRFDEQGQVSFMQRQLAARREQLSADNIAVYQLEAKRVLELSTALRAGNVRLIQGRWQDGIVTTCAGKTVRPNLDDNSQSWLSKRGANSAETLGIAWLDSPEGQQLLLVANQDFCSWEPQPGSL
ncbi:MULTISPECIES: DUF1481 domain-containing protein [Yersinia]|uniref:DUF1481 domain-containing protein n=1 Tax=Yersinia rochesterensis TaxID=1604335 RepID=A0A386HIJ8_9GAMM|nr:MULTISPECIES: DUF1481 domain-containing protein [Yersinia]AJI88490.1 hypothetical protein AW19_2895 [Yersinia frederiksenii Y225]CNH83235.1 lipoprotein [Yersinia kristensenii]AIN19498.1 hypothetical protein DJ57_3711 [Yersinia rochesterensis]AJJ35147.1 hypothetical protein CH54_2894 [Yersinia rochesterensis]AYD45525.1 DUF1481 domain-containing protein [Yersinia rochesterensis]